MPKSFVIVSIRLQKNHSQLKSTKFSQYEKPSFLVKFPLGKIVLREGEDITYGKSPLHFLHCAMRQVILIVIFPFCLKIFYVQYDVIVTL